MKAKTGGTAWIACGCALAIISCSGSGAGNADVLPDDPYLQDVPGEAIPDLPLADDLSGPSEEVTPDTGPPPCVDPWNGSPWNLVSDTTFARGPYLQSVFTDSAVVVWRTAQPRGDPGCVHWESGGESRTTCDEPDDKGQYEVTLTGLMPDIEVTYRVEVGETATSEFTFRTAPGVNRPVRMLVFADAHRNIPVNSTIAAKTLADGAELAVAVGDSVSQPEEAQWDQFLDGFRALFHRVPLWPVLGNHEARGQTYFDAFVVPGAAPEPPEEIFYSVRWGSVWMGMLEIVDLDVAYWLGVEAPEVAWLKEQLSGPEAREARWRFLFIHEPPWSVGWGHCDSPIYYGEKALREVLVPLASEYGVTAIFSGHMHGYAHGETDGVNLFIAGGAGGGLDHECPMPPPEEGLPDPWKEVYEHHRLRVDAGCDLLVVEALALDEENTLIDRVEIPWKAPPPL